MDPLLERHWWPRGPVATAAHVQTEIFVDWGGADAKVDARGYPDRDALLCDLSKMHTVQSLE